MTVTLEIPFPPGHRERYAGRLEPPFVPVEPRWDRMLLLSAPHPAGRKTQS